MNSHYVNGFNRVVKTAGLRDVGRYLAGVTDRTANAGWSLMDTVPVLGGELGRVPGYILGHKGLTEAGEFIGGVSSGIAATPLAVPAWTLSALKPGRSLGERASDLGVAGMGTAIGIGEYQLYKHLARDKENEGVGPGPSEKSAGLKLAMDGDRDKTASVPKAIAKGLHASSDIAFLPVKAINHVAPAIGAIPGKLLGSKPLENVGRGIAGVSVVPLTIPMSTPSLVLDSGAALLEGNPILAAAGLGVATGTTWLGDKLYGDKLEEYGGPNVAKVRKYLPWHNNSSDDAEGTVE